MLPNLDIDLLKTFIAISETGSFTRAGEEVHKTQGAVSMQMKRLEEVVGRPLFLRDGRQNRLTADGERLLDFARRMIRINDEALVAFADPSQRAVVRFGTPDDYADRFLPEILARFARTHPLVQVDVECQPSHTLVERTHKGELDLALYTCEQGDVGRSEVVREEALVWVVSRQHCAHQNEELPIALSGPGCAWRQMALDALEAMGRPYRIAYASTNSNAVNAAIMAGLAVGAIPELVMRPGMRLLTEQEGFPPLGTFRIGMVRAPTPSSAAVDALRNHICDSLCRIGQPLMAAE